MNQTQKLVKGTGDHQCDTGKLVETVTVKANVRQTVRDGPCKTQTYRLNWITETVLANQNPKYDT